MEIEACLYSTSKVPVLLTVVYQKYNSKYCNLFLNIIVSKKCRETIIYWAKLIYVVSSAVKFQMMENPDNTYLMKLY